MLLIICPVDTTENTLTVYPEERVRPLPQKESTDKDDISDNEVPVLDLRGMWSTPSLPLLLGPL